MTTTHPTAGLLKTKEHFEVLDGLRGIAAISVVIFHFMEIAVPDYTKSFIAHAYLAVDFFFCLSGFVIAYAYDAKLEKIGIGSFFKLRLIRLHPLVIIGAVWGLVAFVLDPYANLWKTYADKLWLLLLSGCTMVPYAIVRERYFNLFHLNPPTWSLFWEYIANIVYALVLVKLRNRNKLLWVLVIVGAALLFYESKQATNLSVGWSGDTFWGGGARVLFSFLAGILIYRTGAKIKSKLGFPGLAILLFTTFLTPYSNSTNWFAEPLIVVFVYPLILSLGVGAGLTSRFEKLCVWSGEISYPLYMIHYPFIWLFMSYVAKYKPSLGEMTWIIVIGTALLILLAYVVLKFLDEPIRRFLRKKWITEQAK
ncbi:acyltransferase [Mucilaginibacter panaciglaebae]|uniref:Acyltransferase n=1 Tax=Mucilaginibacter panaciglaebae TaxID=502331 RepID=A0ABP7WTE6_9SPHI